MKHIARLVVLCRAYQDAAGPLEKMRHLYALRLFLVDMEPCMLHVEVELTLFELEQHMTPMDKIQMRDMGYQFPEDLDKPKEFLCNGED